MHSLTSVFRQQPTMSNWASYDRYESSTSPLPSLTYATSTSSSASGWTTTSSDIYPRMLYQDLPSIIHAGSTSYARAPPSAWPSLLGPASPSVVFPTYAPTLPTAPTVHDTLRATEGVSYPHHGVKVTHNKLKVGFLLNH
jgi:hypothetical protein